MGGQIKMAFRFANGEACCFERWTNNMGRLSDLRILDGDEQPVRDYLAMTRNNDYIANPSAMGLPTNFGRGEYGFVLIDYQTKTIIDVNGYTHLFGNISPMSLTKPTSSNDNGYFARWYILLRDTLNSGRGIFRDVHNVETREVERTRLTGIDSLNIVDADIDFERKRMRSHDYTPLSDLIMYHVDTAPFTYISEMDDDCNFRKAFKMARDINFPFTRKEGLNANFPFPRKRKASEQEIKARYLWMKMKELDEYKSFDGVPYDKLSKETINSILDNVNRLTEEDFRSLKFQDMIGSGTARVLISI